MPLPDLIEIVPPSLPPRAVVTIPGSKSITNRALILAALARGRTTLRGALWSEDTQVMVDCLRRLGFSVTVEPDPAEAANRTIAVEGQGGIIPVAGGDTPLDLFVGNAGTAARFVAALVCLGRGSYRLDGVPRMRERPQAALFAALRQLGYRVDADNDRLPAVVHGAGPRQGACTVSVRESSQFASALLLTGPAAGWHVAVSGANDEEMPYVEMTRRLVEVFPTGGGEFQVEPDASSGSYFWGANWLLNSESAQEFPASGGRGETAADPQGSALIHVAHWPTSGWQVDERFPRFLPLPPEVSRRSDLGDSIMTALVLAPFAARPVRFTDLGRLRVQECERVAALRTELTRCGADVREDGDTLTVFPSPDRLRGAEVETYHDHRMAMCFATLALKVPGVRLKNPACVKKTFPNFFQKLAAPPPTGLGVTILGLPARQRLAPEDLVAE
ncbi:MAG: 3-phosphoshikimate 1-carboxyvinyltransferase [Verrucomicrobia bacterium]|jgi:3-phosphoshikimate 1-carboxyvinyltransferase|nr:3-phosphoshikimate 1-carboxyvinyltransferase [Verrucomicrobiota bacterium]